ncbi:MAG: hypothetical protein PWP23_101 [Candidatus Sumerlaeota bacterium]|nr:hypothetical protein [Candidatus Sumerlaeota bacterium]
MPAQQKTPPLSAGKANDRQLLQLTRLESRQVRLVVAMPSLMLLYTVLVALLMSMNLTEIANALPKGEVRSQTEFLADMVLWLGTAGAVAAGGIGILLSWQIVRPLRNLVASMKHVMQGDLPQAEFATHIGEIGLLGSTFNEMVDHLRDLFHRRDEQMREASAGSLLSLDSEGRVLAADEDVATMFGLGLEDILGKRFEHILASAAHTRDSELEHALREQIAEAVAGVASAASIELVLKKNQTPTLFSFSFQPMASAAPKGPACTVDVRDLSAMREFYVQIQRADRLAALGTLAAGIAHEIRNPLASIRGMTQLLGEDLRQAHSEESIDIEYTRRIESEIDRLERIVASIMDFANIREGNPVPTNLNEVLRETFETCRHSFRKSEDVSLKFEWKLDRKLPNIPLERARFQQALLNLIQNAFEDMREKGGIIRFQTLLLDGRHQRPVVIRIANTGFIPQEQRERIFEPFFTTKDEGTGLGLPITYQIVTASNGELEVLCEEGLVIFQIRLPLEGQQAHMLSGKGKSSTHIMKLSSSSSVQVPKQPSQTAPRAR